METKTESSWRKEKSKKKIFYQSISIYISHTVYMKYLRTRTLIWIEILKKIKMNLI
jgi:hypothetical protein